MLNQVPRTLLSIGEDNNMRDDDAKEASSPHIDWKHLTLGTEDKGEGHPPSLTMIVPNSSRNTPAVNGDGRFFNGGHHAGPAASTSVGRHRGSHSDRMKGSMAAFTNESIADQALKDFGSGNVSATRLCALGRHVFQEVEADDEEALFDKLGKVERSSVAQPRRGNTCNFRIIIASQDALHLERRTHLHRKA